MSSGNQSLSNKQMYQVWVTSWSEDGSKDVQEARDACSYYHAVNRLVGQCNDIAEAVRLRDANQSYDPIITKLVTWKTEITDVTESPNDLTNKEL